LRVRIIEGHGFDVYFLAEKINPFLAFILLFVYV